MTEGQIRPAYSRVLLKLGGEMFGGGQVGLDPDVVALVAQQIARWYAAACRWPSSSAVATSSAVPNCSSGGVWNAPVAITWACSAR